MSVPEPGLLTTPLSSEVAKQLPLPFSVDVERLPKPTTDLDAAYAALARYGYCLLENALDVPHLKKITERLAEQARAEELGGFATRDGHWVSDSRRAGMLDETKWQPNQKVFLLVNKGESFRELVTLPQPSTIMNRLLGPKWILSSLWANMVRPGGSPMAMHCDQGGAMPRYHSRSQAMAGGGRVPEGARASDAYSEDTMNAFVRWPSKPFNQAQLIEALNKATLPDHLPPPIVAQVMYFVSDVTPANGGTCVVPGSHLSGMLPPLDQDFSRIFPTVNLSGKAGTACIFDGRLWHATGANVTSDEKRDVIFQYCCSPQMRQQENITMALRREVYDQCSDELRRRLGFRVWGPYNYTEKESRESQWIGYEQELLGEMRLPATKSRL